MIDVKFFLFDHAAKMPVKERPSDAGIDLFCREDFVINPKSSVNIGLGIGWEPEEVEGYNVYAQIKARSGWAIKRGIEVSSAGVIDEMYRGEWVVKLFNTTRTKVEVKKGSKVAQALIFLLPKVSISEIDISLIGQTDRGATGFGSSGF